MGHILSHIIFVAVNDKIMTEVWFSKLFWEVGNRAYTAVFQFFLPIRNMIGFLVQG
jgi:hypothetical protein